VDTGKLSSRRWYYSHCQAVPNYAKVVYRGGFVDGPIGDILA
jgi:hypothetical protein